MSQELIKALLDARKAIDNVIQQYAAETMTPLTGMKMKVKAKGTVVRHPKDEDFADVKRLFLEFYQSQKGVEYYFEAKDGAAVKKITAKLKFISKEDNVSDSFNVILQRLKKVDPWVFDNLSLPILNSKLDVIIAKIKAGGEAGQKYNDMLTDIQNRLKGIK